MSNNHRAILWALLASALFAIEAVIIKSAVADFHVLQILFFRQVIILISTLPIITRNFPNNLVTQHPFIHILRLSGAFVALVMSIWALAVLPLTLAVTLSFTKVFFISLLAAMFLRETIGPHRVTAVVLGFIGVLVVMQPGTNDISFYVFIPIVGAIGAAIAQNCVRYLSQIDSTAILLSYQAIFIGLLAGIPLLWLWQTPDISGLLYLVAIGFFATIGQWTIVSALRIGDASVVGSVQYIQLVFAAILGFFVFGEIPDKYTIAGAALIVLAALYLYHRETEIKKRQQMLEKCIRHRSLR